MDHLFKKVVKKRVQIIKIFLLPPVERLGDFLLLFPSFLDRWPPFSCAYLSWLSKGRAQMEAP